MRTAILLGVVLTAALAGAAQAQTAPLNAPVQAPVFDKAPWWMDRPIIASTGYVKSEMTANRASFHATYEVVDKDPSVATKAAADKVRDLGGVLAAFGAENVRVATTFEINPLYDQYRDKDGELIDNERADKIRSYQVAVRVEVLVRDVRLIEKVYATALSAKPSRASDVTFGLEIDNETRSQMFRAAVADAARRARLAAEAASGTPLGRVRLIDPTGRACQTDVLVALAPRERDNTAAAPLPAPPMVQPRSNSGLEEIIVTAQRRGADVGLRPQDFQLPLQPSSEWVEAKACVVFSLGQ